MDTKTTAGVTGNPTKSQIMASQLRQYQALSLNGVIRLSEMRVHEAMEHFDGRMYMAISGKDSCAGAHLIWNLYPNVPAVFVDTGNELDSVKQNIYEMIEAGRPIEIIYPDKSFWEVNEKYGWPILSKKICMGISRFCSTKSFRQKKLRAFGGTNPTSGKKQARTIPKKYHYILKAVLAKKLKVTTKCCGELKIKPFVKYEKRTGRKPFVFTMAADSLTRKESYLKNGCNVFKKGSEVSRPVMFWTEQHILQYIREHGVKIPTAYAKKVGGEWVFQEQLPSGKWRMCGDDRTGCKFCMFGIQFENEKEINRIQRLAETEPESYAEFVQHGGGDVMDLLGIEWRVD